MLDLSYIEIKDLEHPALAFVLNSWLLSHKQTLKSGEDYFKVWTPRVKRLIANHRLFVSEFDMVPGQYLGWICGDTGVLDYVYVKLNYRKVGFSGQMIRSVCGDKGVYTFPSRNKDFIASLERRGFLYKDIYGKGQGRETDDQIGDVEIKSPEVRE